MMRTLCCGPDNGTDMSQSCIELGAPIRDESLRSRMYSVHHALRYRSASGSSVCVLLSRCRPWLRAMRSPRPSLWDRQCQCAYNLTARLPTHIDICTISVIYRLHVQRKTATYLDSHDRVRVQTHDVRYQLQSLHEVFAA